MKSLLVVNSDASTELLAFKLLFVENSTNLTWPLAIISLSTPFLCDERSDQMRRQEGGAPSQIKDITLAAKTEYSWSRRASGHGRTAVVAYWSDAADTSCCMGHPARRDESPAGLLARRPTDGLCYRYEPTDRHPRHCPVLSLSDTSSWLCCKLTARSTSTFCCRFEHFEVRSDLTWSIETPSNQQRNSSFAFLVQARSLTFVTVINLWSECSRVLRKE